MEKIGLLLNEYVSNPKGWRQWLKNKNEIIEELNNIFPQVENLNEKIYWIKNNLNSYPRCPICGNEIKKWKGRNKGGYFKFCSCKCAQADKNTRDKIKNTCLKKYGVDNAAKARDIQSKMKNTCLEKYGTKNIFSSEIGKKKIKETLLKKYGVENPQQNNEIKKKTKETLLKKYGITCGFQKCKKYNVSKGELELYDFIKSIKSTAIHNDRKNIFPLELDIFLEENNIGIEYDGEYWHNLPKMKKRDYLKNKICKEKGIKLIRVKEKDWKNDKEKVKKILMEEINGFKKIV